MNITKPNSIVLTLVLAATIVVATSSTAVAGPWVKQPGEAYLKLSGDYFSSDEAFDVDGELQESPYTYSHRAVRAFGEVGLAESVGLQFSAPFMASTNKVSDYSRYDRWGFGDMDLAVQYQIFEGGCAASVASWARVPLYGGVIARDATVNAGGSSGDPYTPALGDGSVDVGAKGAVGCPLSSSVESWAAVEAGPRYRTAGFGPSLDYAFDAGAFIIPDRLALSGRVGGVQRLTENNERPTKSYIDVGSSLLFQVRDSIALEAGGNYIPHGAYIARGWSAHLGVSFSGQLF
ncbi:MAG: hypothetical protein ACOCV2_06950 [Persicimonas sp.]